MVVDAALGRTTREPHMNTNIDFALGPFVAQWDNHNGFESVAVVNSKGDVIEGFEEHEENHAEELLDWLNAKHEGGHHPIPFWYKELLQWRAQDAHNVPDNFDDYDQDAIPF